MRLGHPAGGWGLDSRSMAPRRGLIGKHPYRWPQTSYAQNASMPLHNGSSKLFCSKACVSHLWILTFPGQAWVGLRRMPFPRTECLGGRAVAPSWCACCAQWQMTWRSAWSELQCIGLAVYIRQHNSVSRQRSPSVTGSFIKLRGKSPFSIVQRWLFF